MYGRRVKEEGARKVKEQINISAEVAFIWQSAETLRDTYKPHQYQDIILPFVVLRRIESVLLEKRDEVEEKNKSGLSKLGEVERKKIIATQVTSSIGFDNKSNFTFKLLASEKDTAIKENFKSYINGYTDNIRIILEKFGIPYVGADGFTMSLTLDKIMTKKMLKTEGIPTPHFMPLDRIGDLMNLDHLKFPLIAKLRWEGTSKGISDKSVVKDEKELKEQVGFLFNTYDNSPIILEELVVGSEFTVPIVGNDPAEVFPPVQVSICDKLDIGDMIYTFQRITNTELKYVCPAKIDKEMDRRLRELALKTYQAVDCKDFGRVDFRVDRKGDPYVLEINPLPSLSDEDVFTLSPKVVGYDFNEIINKIINAALKRYQIN